MAPPELNTVNSKTSAEAPPANVARPPDSTPLMEKVPLDPHVPMEAYDTMREKGPVVRVSFDLGDVGEPKDAAASEFREFLGREHLFVTRYEDVIESLLDDRISSDPRTAMTPEQQKKLPQIPEELRPLSHSIITLDAPDHTRLRKLVQPSFTPRAMEALRGRIQKIAEDLLDKAEREAAERGETGTNRKMDLIESFAYPLPVTVISDMLGIPVEDREMVRGWTENLLKNDRRRNGFDEATRAKMREFTDYLRRLFKAKRERPAEDMISQLLRAEEDGDKLNEDETLSMVFILYLAGHVTTVNLIGNGVYALMSFPDQLAKLKANPGLTKGLVEETLRYWGPVDFISRRIPKVDLDLAGTHIPKGEPIMVGLASANHDPERFPNPHAFDISRPDADKHVAFGKGIHICLGAPLARMEGQIAFETLFRRLPSLRLAVPSEEIHWGSSFLRGVGKLPMLF
jgi:cytochrome P450